MVFHLRERGAQERGGAGRGMVGGMDASRAVGGLTAPGVDRRGRPAMTWQAMVRQQREGEASAAESLYRAALAVEGVNSPDAALTMEFLAHFRLL
jgi:hypothetical protein